MSDVYEEIERTSRGKRHCEACRQLIPAGTRYLDCSGLVDGLWFHCAMHLPCMALYQEVRKEVAPCDCEEFLFCDLGEAIRESGDAEWVDTWAALTGEAK